jgi:hypothetical protein
MKVATKGDKPDWFARPANVVGTNVCRLSGKLPNDGCTQVEVVARDGMVETRSMVYTEYFVKGTQPSTICPLHSAPSFFDRIAGAFGKDSDTPPVPADAAGLPPAGSASTGGTLPPGSPVARPAPPEQGDKGKDDKDEKVGKDGEKEKRGFWSKLFGRGKDDDKKKQDEKKQQETKKKPGGGIP